jgi:hypothetical protein
VKGVIEHFMLECKFETGTTCCNVMINQQQNIPFLTCLLFFRAPSVVGIIPYAALDLTLNSWLKDQASVYMEGVHQESSIPVLLGCGMASSGTATIVTFPLNVIRTRAQANGESVGHILRWLQANGGWRAFYRGLTPCLAKVMPATSFSYAAYEALSGAWDRKLLPHHNSSPNK